MLVTSLSQLLVAFTIEFDDAFESRMPHRTARGPAAGSTRGPWLVSRAMWANFLRWIPDDGLLGYESLAAVTNLAGLQRWGYLEVEGERARLKRGGVAANRIWARLTAEIEDRWRDRFGSEPVARLSSALAPLSDRGLPWALPVVGHRGTSERLEGWSSSVRGADDELPTLLARALIAYARQHESRSDVPLHLSLNALRIADGVPSRDVPRLAGISREAATMSLGQLERQGYLKVGPTVSLTERGAQTRDGQAAIAAEVERSWDAAVVAAADALLDDTDALRAGLQPHPEGWRAHPPYLAQTKAVVGDPRGALPHFPMVLHRGGYPDGS